MTLDREALRNNHSESERLAEASGAAGEAAARYRLVGGKAVFDEAALTGQRRLRMGLFEYFRTAPPSALVTAPFIYGMIVPIAILDLCVVIYQAACFPVWGVKKAIRSEYFRLDRHRLVYLNGIERLNCIYCGYANGVIAFAREVAARTEQYFCPIKHASEPADAHDRYDGFLDYGDAEAWRTRLDELRDRIG